MVQPCTYVLIFSLVKTSKVLSVVLILTQLCTLWRRNKLLIRPRKQSSSYIGLRPPFGPFPMIDELKQAFFFFGGSSYDNLWFPVSFPNLLLRKHIERLSFWFCTKLIFEGAVVQLHLTCRDHCFAWFSSAKFISSKNMIIFLYGIEEPSKMCPDLNEWRLSSVGWGTPLGLGRHGFESCWSLNFCSGFSVFAIVWNTGQLRGSLSNLFYFILFP